MQTNHCTSPFTIGGDAVYKCTNSIAIKKKNMYDIDSVLWLKLLQGLYVVIVTPTYPTPQSSCHP
jgi:hypothetical protein